MGQVDMGGKRRHSQVSRARGRKDQPWRACLGQGCCLKGLLFSSTRRERQQFVSACAELGEKDEEIKDALHVHHSDPPFESHQRPR